MAWTTGLVVQNGLTERFYEMKGKPGMSVFDLVTAGPQVGPSRVKMLDHVVSQGPIHVLGVRVTGPEATQFIIRGGLPA